MVEPIEFRRGPDRRRQSRGGRRSTDVDGAAPRHELLLRTATQVPVVMISDSLDRLIDDIRRALRVTPINLAQMR